MLSKIVLFVVLGSALVLGSPISSEIYDGAQSEESQLNQVDEIINQVNGTLKEFYDQLKVDYDEAIEELKKFAQSVEEISDKKLVQLEKNYENYKKNILKALLKHEKSLQVRLGQWKVTGEAALNVSQAKFDTWKKKILDQTEQEKNKSQKKFNDWKEKSILSIEDIRAEYVLSTSFSEANKKIKEVMKDLKSFSSSLAKKDKKKYNELKKKLSTMENLAKKAMKEANNKMKNELKDLHKRTEKAITAGNTDYDEYSSVYGITKEYVQRLFVEELLILEAKHDEMKQVISDSIPSDQMEKSH